MMSSDSSRVSKRPRQCSGNSGDEDEPPLDLLSLYQSDFGDRILSFASGADLCTLDALNKKFNTLTTEQWKVVTKDRFGMNNGKEGWRQGTSFLRPPVFIHMSPHDCEQFDFKSPTMAANESIIAIVDEDYKVVMRDSLTLEVIRRGDSTISKRSGRRVALCGSLGLETVVTSNNYEIQAEIGISYNSRIVDSLGIGSHAYTWSGGSILIIEVIMVLPQLDVILT